jgi:hypothetical protein
VKIYTYTTKKIIFRFFPFLYMLLIEKPRGNTVIINKLLIGARGGARNFLLGGLSPPNSNFNPDTKIFFTCFRKISGWAQHPFGWAEPTPAHPWRRH